MIRGIQWIASLLLLCALESAGCAPAEYDILQPPEFARHIDTSHDVFITRGPVRYDLISYENHLILQVFNTSARPLQMLADQSFVVDPDGESHSLPTRLIPPQAYIRLILPPVAAAQAPNGPAVGFGVDAGQEPGFYTPYDEPVLPSPHPIVAPPVWQEYWRWPDGQSIRISLTFDQGGEPPFTQAFVIRRQRG